MIAFLFQQCCLLPTAVCSTGLLQPGGCFLFNYNNCTFVSFASWWWSFVVLALSLIWSRTQKGTLWRRSGLPTSAGRFYGYVTKMGLTAFQPVIDSKCCLDPVWMQCCFRSSSGLQTMSHDWECLLSLSSKNYRSSLLSHRLNRGSASPLYW